MLDPGYFFGGWLESATSKYVKKFHKYLTFFNFFPKISSGQVKKYPGQRQVGPLFIAGQKYARVGLELAHL